MGARAGCGMRGTQGWGCSQASTAWGKVSSSSRSSQAGMSPSPPPAPHLWGTSRVTEQQRDLSHPSRPSQRQGAGGEAVNSALPLIKHLAVTEASQHASFSDTFTVWGNGVSGL